MEADSHLHSIQGISNHAVVQWYHNWYYYLKHCQELPSEAVHSLGHKQSYQTQ